MIMELGRVDSKKKTLLTVGKGHSRCPGNLGKHTVHKWTKEMLPPQPDVTGSKGGWHLGP